MNALYRPVLTLVICIIAICHSSLIAQEAKYNFRHITSNEGLPHDHITAVLKDSRGFMWFGTELGLTRFDGIEFYTYINNPENSTSISYNYIQDILEDKKDNLLITTATGFDRYVRESDSFIHYNLKMEPTDLFEDSKGNLWIGSSKGLYIYDVTKNAYKIFRNEYLAVSEKDANNHVRKIVEGRQGILWIATRNGLNKFDVKTGKFKRFVNDPNDPKSIGGNLIMTVYKDSKGRIWIGSRGDGISILDETTETFVNFKYNPKNKKGLAHNDILSFSEDEEGKIWIGTENGGISILDYENKLFRTLKKELDNENSLNNTSIWCLYKDDLKNLWVGTYAGGINLLPFQQERFVHYKESRSSTNKLSSNNILSIYGDSDDEIWIGTDGEGLNLFDRKKKTFSHLRHDTNNVNSPASDIIFSVTEVRNGLIAIGYHRGGFDLYDKKTGKFTHHLHDKNNLNSLSDMGVLALLKEADGPLWLATPENGLNSYDIEKKEFKLYQNNPLNRKTLSGNTILSLLLDKKGDLWVGTSFGLNRRDKKDNSFTQFVHNDTIRTTISNNIAYSIFEDSKENLWIGTGGGGLNLLDRKTGEFKHYKESAGLAGTSVFGILEDEKGNIWLSTNKGISKFNIETQTFKNYDVDDGLQGSQFRFNATYKTKDGEMYFGGTQGFNAFYPQKVVDNPHIPPVVLTDFELFNKRVKMDSKNSPLPKNILELNQIVLDNTQSVFTFRFAALNYSLPKKNKYAFKMEGFDKDWNYVGTQRFATYTNLDPGHYVFKVKAANNDGIWNETGKSINVIITPPFWKTFWFRGLIGAVILSSLIGFYNIRLKVIRDQKRELEMQVVERTTEIVKQKEQLETQTRYLQDANEDLKAQKEELYMQAEKLHKANDYLNQQKEEISSQRVQIENLYVDLKDSIRAAEYIQASILPTETFIKKYLPESFILNIPKDVVSGDFYWFDVKNDKIITAVADCTGHGVSGAFMSINAHHLLNQAIYPFENLVAAEILDRLNESLLKQYYAHNKQESMGMDISLCIIDLKNFSLQFAGARNPLYIVRKENLIQVKGNTFSIGVITKKLCKFENTIVPLEKGDTLYLFSDGYADQIDETEEKFLYQQFRDLIVKTAPEQMEAQPEIFKNTINHWKGKQQQLDDILLVGIRI